MSVSSISELLQILSNPLRESIILSLKGSSLMYSDIMRSCGLDPNYDTGPFNYHISVLLDSNLIEKKQNMYQLSVLGGTIVNFIQSLQRESSFLLQTREAKEVKKQMGKIEAKWLTQEDLNKEEHGPIGLTSPKVQTPPTGEKIPTEERKRFYDWQKKLPQPDIPPSSFFGYVLGFEKGDVKLGCIYLRFCVRSATNAATAQVMGMWIADDNYRKIGETRQSLLWEMMNELLRQLREHGTEVVEMENVYSGDQDLVKVLKELAFERAATKYFMRKKLI